MSEVLGVPGSSIGSILRKPGVGTTFGLSIIARLPATAIGTLVALKVAAGHNWTTAGVTDAVIAVSLAVAAPAWARMLGRRAPSLILGGLSVAHAVALVGFAVVAAGTPVWAFIVLAAFVGATEPIHGPAMRGVWDELLASDEDRHVGYALDSASLEALFAFSTAVFVGLIAATFGVDAGLLATAAVGALGGVWFALLPVLRAWTPAAEAEASAAAGGARLLGAFSDARVRTLAALSFAMGLHLGPLELGVPALGRELGSLHAAGALMAIWGVGSMLAALWLTRLPHARQPGRRMGWIFAWLAVTSCTLLAATSVPVAAVLLFVGGTGIAPLFATLNGSFGLIAPEESAAEMYAITLSGLLVGAMAGAPIAGIFVDHISAQAGLASAGIGPLLGIALILIRSRDLRPVS